MEKRKSGSGASRGRKTPGSTGAESGESPARSDGPCGYGFDETAAAGISSASAAASGADRICDEHQLWNGERR